MEAQRVGPVRQHVIVPRRDLARFGQLAGAEVHDVAEFLPRSFRQLPGFNGWLNLRRPVPPLRGWIVQQIVKLAAAARSEADVVLLVDSDIEFVRPFGIDHFQRDGVACFYRKPGEIDDRLPRHVLWHQVARKLLGLPPAAPPFTDYVCWPAPWDPRIVRELLRRVESVSGRPWATTIGAQLHFSEEILYGVFVDEVLGAPATAYATDDMRCLGYSAEVPLDAHGLDELLDRIAPGDIAVMISAKSGTPLPLRRAALAARFPAGDRRVTD
ncbi:hypothetical protein C1I93_13875 [Micromonospora endophytica]|uniref:Uncharacterized protein n=1 Tax=Micromonospora endophytica TaxID=515350 RepID=A0A2W2CD60_9ACTN|nr:hypothetical protein C1I93_13875 [Micromonospora endophytica]RIW49981.1 hypothetical protein D3H59_04150 [Micromonospora endophytica]